MELIASLFPGQLWDQFENIYVWPDPTFTSIRESLTSVYKQFTIFLTLDIVRYAVIIIMLIVYCFSVFRLLHDVLVMDLTVFINVVVNFLRGCGKNSRAAYMLQKISCSTITGMLKMFSLIKNLIIYSLRFICTNDWNYCFCCVIVQIKQ